MSAVPTARARALLRELVEIPSPSGEEADCADALVEFFASHGREAYRDEVGNVRAPADDAVLLTSHIDTVPGAIPVRVEDDVLWGRGAVDAKGPLAAMATAAVRTGVSFVGVVGEETDSRGARHLVETRAPPAALVNGEPSGWAGVTFGYRGFLAGTYTARTESAHRSRTDPNAIQQGFAWWDRVETAVAPEDLDETAVTDRVTAKPTEVAGGLTDDGLAVEAEIRFQLRVPIGGALEAVRERAEAQLEDGSIRWHDAIPPVLADRRTALARTFRTAIRQEGGDPRPLVKSGTADMNLYAAAWDCPMVTYGPGDSDLDHAPDERLPLTEFDRSVAVLETVARHRREA